MALEPDAVGVLEQGGEVAQEAGSGRAIHGAVVEGEREHEGGARGEDAVHGQGDGAQPAEAQDADLRRVEDGREGIDAERPEFG